MIGSANEVMNLAAKAARGAGIPPAQAMMFGRAVVCHLARGRDARTLQTALEAAPDGPILTIPLALSRFVETSEGDTATGQMPLCADGDLMLSYAQSQPFAATAKVRDDALDLTLTLTAPNTFNPGPRITLPDDLAGHMQTLAARILVPESEASRLSGAGAGLTDND